MPGLRSRRFLPFAVLCVLGVLPVHGQSHENWTAWSPLDGETLTAAPAVAENGDGRLEVFIRNGTGVLKHRSQTAAGSDTWSSWGNLGSGTAGSPVAIADSAGRLWVFARSTSGTLFVTRQSVLGGGWTPFADFGGGLQGDPAPVLFDNRLHVFVRGTDDVIYFKSQTFADNPTIWSGWVNLGGKTLSKPAPVVNMEGGRLDVYVRGNDHALYNKHYEKATGVWSPQWLAVPGVVGVQSDPAVATNGFDVLIVARSTTDGRLWHIFRSSPGSWGPWTSLGDPVPASDPTLAVNQDGRREVFVRGTDGNLHHNYQSSGGVFTGWSSLGGMPAANWDIAVARNLDGRLQVFVRTSVSSLDHKAQAVPGG